jgi:O-antigen/teichoic acid export membrane protein
VKTKVSDAPGDSPTPFSLRKVFKGASIYGLGEILVKASGFFLIPIYTRVLTPADYGIVGYLQVFLQIATVIVAFGAHGAQTRYYYENSADAQMMGRFAFTINLVPVAVALCIGLPFALFGSIFNWTIGSANIPFYPYMVLTLWTVVLQVLANNAVSWYRARQQFTAAMVLQVARFLSITGFTLLLILGFELGALGRIGGMAAGMTVFVLLSFTGYTRHFVWRPSREALRYALAFGAPIVVHLLAANIHNAIDRIILERFVALDQLGIYTLSFTIGHTLNMFLTAFNQAYQPSYFQLMSSDRGDKEEQVIKTFKVWLVMITVVSSVGILLGGPFLRVFAGPRFVASIDVFPWMILAVFVGGFSLFFSSPIFYFKKTKVLPLKTGASAAVNIGLNLWLIPVWGIMGAAVATVISHVVSSVLSLIIGNRLYPMRWPYGWIVSSIAIVCGAVVAAHQLGW